MKERIRGFARQYLPPKIRSPLGAALGRFNEWAIEPLLGLIFDLRGGRFSADGCTFVIPKDLTSRAYRACFLRGDYEEEERGLIKQFVRSEDRVLELGACLGIVSCVTNRLLADRSAHVVVEGNPMLIPAIHRNRKLNDCGFLVENCAASTDRDVTFYLHPVYVVGGSTQRESNLPVRVPGRTIAELVERYGPFSVLIIDVEGSEHDLFANNPSTLHSFRLVIAELHPWAIGEGQVHACRQMLESAGFKKVGACGLTEAWQRADVEDRPIASGG
jgi:FkbM family methyltransferase